MGYIHCPTNIYQKKELVMMHKTKNDLPENTRVAMIAVLQETLATAIDLQLQIKTAHWNVRGPDFIALHKLFDEIATAAVEYVDTQAERIAQLGGIAEGTIRAAAKRSHLAEYPLNISSGRDHVEALSTALATAGKSFRKGINQADEVNDKDTADIYTEISRGVDQYLWFVEAQLQDKA
jgi:starvation-inducible DNA-binding protein